MLLLKNTVKELHSKFTQIPNDLINDRNLSQGAKGVYCYLASKPDGWNFVISEIRSHFTKPIKPAIQELEAAKWLVRQTEPIKGKGKGFSWVWYIAATPFTDEEIATIRDFKYGSKKEHAISQSNYDSKNTTIVKSGGYNNTDCYSNTELSNNTDSNLSHPVSPSLPLTGDSPEPPSRNSTISDALERFQDAWNSKLCDYCPTIAKITVFNDSRRSKVKARLTETAKLMKAQGVEKDLLLYFLKDIIYDRYTNSQFLRGEVPGRNGTAPFKLTIDNITRPEFFAKLVEYRYDDRPEYRC